MNNSKKIFFIALFLIIFLLILNNFDKIKSQQNVEESEIIIIPIKAHIIEDFSEIYSSERNEENILQLFEQTNRIWRQGNIYFQIEEMVLTEVNSQEIINTLNGNSVGLYNHENFDRKKINAFFVENLNDINGLALKNINSILVSDFTTVNDYRTTAHELGHILGLNHVLPSDKLMARGKNGELLSFEEIQIARKNSFYFHNIS